MCNACPSGAVHNRTKHIDLRHHYVRESVANGMLKVEWVPSQQQLADVFTKGLGKQAFIQLTQRIMDNKDKNNNE